MVDVQLNIVYQLKNKHHLHNHDKPLKKKHKIATELIFVIQDLTNVLIC